MLKLSKKEMKQKIDELETKISSLIGDKNLQDKENEDEEYHNLQKKLNERESMIKFLDQKNKELSNVLGEDINDNSVDEIKNKLTKMGWK